MRTKNVFFAIVLVSISFFTHAQTSIEYYDKGVDKGKLGDIRGAVMYYNKAIELDPEFKEAYFNRGVCKYELGDIDGACLDFSKDGELGNWEAYDMIQEYCN
ncbi:MAG: tetratricopeptide repeat protein [Bacteroidetes bacterium]|nr:tetratricopeptide repeat protein [Bacteroidota bacterium]MBL7105628.1 tetratricopeptide repeat protein [Bacteroidales bacterium]